MRGYVRTFALMALLTALFVGVAGMIGGLGWMVGAFVVAAAVNFGSYWWSDRIVLRMYGARVIERADAPRLFDAVDELRREAGLPMPTVAIAPTAQPNAFATGRSPSRAVVCATEGLLEAVDEAELRAILSHEIAHVANRDMLVGTIAATLGAAIIFLARFGLFFGGDRDSPFSVIGLLLMIVLAPIAAILIQLAVSRSNELRADSAGARIGGRPLDLARALRTLDREAERRPWRVNPAASHLCIVNPLRGRAGGGFSALFRTHPPTEERVRRLEEIARQMGATERPTARAASR